MKVVIMAGGKGTRISSISPNIPKPLMLINGIPVLEREIVSLRDQGFVEIILTVGYMAEQIVDYFGDGSRFGVNIEYFIEKKPLGNAGALFKIKNLLSGEFLLLNGDVIFDVDFKRFVAFHKKKGGLVTLFTHPNSHPYDSGIIIADEDGKVKQWLSKEDCKPLFYKNRVNAGLHIINAQVLDLLDINENIIGEEIEGKSIKLDLDRHLLKPLCGTGAMYCYDSSEYVKDMGTPERFYNVCKDFDKGIVESRNLGNKQKAIFLDRDGTLNKYVGFLKEEKQFELLPKVVEAIKIINESGYLAIVVTNQPVIARGEITCEELQIIHNKMETLLGNEGAYIDAIYYCPHHPDRGYMGEITELKQECNCRKPNPGMLLTAADDYNIDLKKSWIVGDSERDVLAGRKAGCKTALIGDGDFEQNLTVNSLYDFVRKVLF